MEKRFSEDLFRNPPKEYRGAPFWAWNGRLDKDVLKEQMDVLKEMGFGGFHIHSRIGLSTPYMGPDFLDCVKFCNDYCKENDMLTWLYDEDKWPSGYGGGFVTENVDYRARYLLFSHNHYPDGYHSRKRPMQGRLTEDGDLTLMARYDVQVRDGRMESYRRLSEEEPAGENTWYAYELIAEKQPWFNNAAYVDVLNPDAIKCFIQNIHEKYKACIGDEFSRSVPAIFTDEPQFTKTQPLADGDGYIDGGATYTKDMDRLFAEAYGYSFLDRLPEVFWENADGSLSEMNYHYHDFVAQRFADVYSATLGKWCGENNLMLTGHLMYEDSLERQTKAIGDAMRSYPHFQLPGIDILANLPQYNTAKQAQSACRQEGKPGISSELYGVTNWDYDFRGHKLQGDWQAALGITVRVPHLAWLYMGGEAKRDYPSPIDQHATWYKKYPVIENHFARVNTVLTRGKAQVRVGVLHPIESYWMIYGPVKQTMQRRQEMDDRFEQLTHWLLFNLVDFDFLSEGLLPNQKLRTENGKLYVGEMSYEVIVVPRLLTIRSTTLEILKKFQAEGGKLILLGELPEYVDAKPSCAAKALAGGAKQIGFDKDALLEELDAYRDLDVRNAGGMRPAELFYQMRVEDDCKWLFVCHGKAEERTEANFFFQSTANDIEFRVRGQYQVELLDTMNGTIEKIPCVCKNGHTIFSRPCYAQDSFLFRLTETQETEIRCAEAPARQLLREQYLPGMNAYRLEEPNCLLLDQADWRLDGGDWMGVEEILKLDDQVRRSCGMRLRTDSFPQPWLSGGVNEKKHIVELRYEIESRIALEQVSLAFEGDEDVELCWNGCRVEWKAGEYYVDRCINKIALGALKQGRNELMLRIPFGINTNVEWSYLLGDFGVSVFGRTAVITPAPEKIGFGDYARQGLAFYGGNLVYETEFDCGEGFAELEIPHYSASTLEVWVDDEAPVCVFMDPCKVQLGALKAGRHRLQIRAYGSRINQFGQVHNCNLAERYFSPKTWRTGGTQWCYEYRLKPCGVLAAPTLRIYK